MNYLAYQQDGFNSSGDCRLPQKVRLLKRLFYDLQSQLTLNAFRLNKNAVEELSGILVDFAVDVHNDIGIWAAYERYNQNWFGLPLPITGGGNTGISVDRIRHLLWHVYPQLIDNCIIIPPDHADLLKVTGAVHDFLQQHIVDLPRDSGIKAFLATPNEYGWDVKRKLLWMGTKSYLFRQLFKNYMHENEVALNSIDHIDDFICQECTCWSGLGVIDVLAETLNIPDDQRKELRSWYERHTAPYKLSAVNNEVLEAINVISNHPYIIRINMDRHPFQAGQLVFGSLTPWKGEWYWSGAQRLLGEADDELIEECKRNMRQSTSIIGRYWKEYEQMVRERMAEQYQKMMGFYGNDLIIYPDGLSMAADWDREMQDQWKKATDDKARAIMKEHGLREPRTRMPLPRNLIESQEGLAVFINPDEGKEIALNFNRIVAGLKKKGNGLTTDEIDAIQDFMLADAVSPAFVKRIVHEYGTESIGTALELGEHGENYWLDYALRSMKGHFYRKRYPALSIAM